MSHNDVIVIGGGVAGLAAATALVEQGARVCLVEARPALGGRATSYRDPVTRETIDNGQHILMGCYRESFDFLRRIGTAGLVRLQRALEVPTVDSEGRRSSLVCPELPAPWHLLGGILEWDALSWRDRLSVFRIGPAIMRARRTVSRSRPIRAEVSDETVRQWLIRHGQTPRIRELLWEPLTLAAMNQPASQAGSAAFLPVLASAFGSDPRDSAIALPRVSLSDLVGIPGRAFIESRGGEVRTSTPVRVLIENGKAVGVVPRNGEAVRAAAVVSAVPWHDLSSLFTTMPAPMAPVVERARRMKAFPIVTVNLWFDRPVLDVPFVGMPGREMQWVFDRNAILGGRASHLSLVSSGAAHLMSSANDDIIALALAEIRGALPAAAEAVLRHASVVRERKATFSVAPGEPERPGAETGVPGLLLAGDWTNTSLPGTIESAAQSGHVAAAQISR